MHTIKFRTGRFNHSGLDFNYETIMEVKFLIFFKIKSRLHASSNLNPANFIDLEQKYALFRLPKYLCFIIFSLERNCPWHSMRPTRIFDYHKLVYFQISFISFEQNIKSTSLLHWHLKFYWIIVSIRFVFLWLKSPDDVTLSYIVLEAAEYYSQFDKSHQSDKLSNTFTP